MNEQQIQDLIQKPTNGLSVQEKIHHYKKCQEYGKYTKAELISPYPVGHIKNEIYSFAVLYLKCLVIQMDEVGTTDEIVEKLFADKVDINIFESVLQGE